MSNCLACGHEHPDGLALCDICKAKKRYGPCYPWEFR